ncbi:MAG TPA: bacillithiol biosynthesis cysteine-adding enzyme BshC [Gemmatimonadales bacterium]
MIPRILDTPLSERLAVPAPREAAWDARLDPAIVAAAGTDALTARLHAPGALVVTTGQQAGLFTGPSYTVTKALSARALARALETRWNRPVIPVFWVPGDDHDFDEVSSASWLDGDGDLVRAALTPRPAEAPLTPMARLQLGSSVLEALAAFERSFPNAATSAPVVAWLRRHYRPEATVAGAFAGAMAELLAPYGILCLDSTHPAVKAAAAPLVLRALAESRALDEELATRSARLVREGRDPGVPVGDGASLAFVETPEGRDRLIAGEPAFRTRRGRTPVTLPELEVIARQEPSRLSGNVLLRPVLESALLPTVAYVAGPGELRYLALTPPVYARLGVAPQAPVPRWSGLLLEPRVGRVLDKFGATLEELTAPGGALEARLARLALPDGTEAAFQRLRDAIEEGYGPVVRASAGIDPTLERPAAAGRGRALDAVTRLEKKLLQHARQRQSVELGQVARARLSVRPGGQPQERVLTLAGFLARYGPGILDDYAGHIAAWYAGALEGAPATP